MFAFEKFPATIIKKVELVGLDRKEIFRVDVYGYFEKLLVIFRLEYKLINEIGEIIQVKSEPVAMLPIDEFEREFEGYQLIGSAL